MKKLLSILVILVATAITLTACSASNTNNSTDVASETSTTVAEDSVTTETVKGEYITDNNICTQDEYEKTLFGQAISTERNGEIRLGIKCTYDHYAEVTVYEANNGAYVPIFNCPATIGQNGPVKHAEGDTKTPLGTWEIGEAYGIKEDPGALLPYTQVTDDDYWCATGNHGKKYNQLLHKSDEPDADYSEDEHLLDYPIRYAYFIDLGYNKACAPYAGNAIFLHCWLEPDRYTGGCVAVSEESMIQLLKLLPPGAIVTIY